MTRVCAPSRLHFGLIGFAELWPNAVPTRRFGGAGLMVQAPGVDVSVSPASAWSVEGPLGGRALAVALRLSPDIPPHKIIVSQCAPEHSGLGTGTQLSLAVARALSHSCGQIVETTDLARRIGRGARSALGVHGFDRGGFLLDCGKGVATEVAPLAARVEFPEAWRVLLVRPQAAPGLHGDMEMRAFAQLAQSDVALAATERLARLALLGLLPCLLERDFAGFSEAVHEFNAKNGELFATTQGDVYASPQSKQLVTLMRQWGVRGVGQSSWGPTLFALVEGEAQGQALMRRLRESCGSSCVVDMTAAQNSGATVE
jgi:beta-RFAP synthase